MDEMYKIEIKKNWKKGGGKTPDAPALPPINMRPMCIYERIKVSKKRRI